MLMCGIENRYLNYEQLFLLLTPSGRNCTLQNPANFFYALISTTMSNPLCIYVFFSLAHCSLSLPVHELSFILYMWSFGHVGVQKCNTGK